MNSTYHKMGPWFTVAYLASSSMAAALHNPQPMKPGAAFPVRGAATYKAQAVDLRAGSGTVDGIAEQLGLRPITNGLIALSAALLSMGK
ncbi:hypothetical protein PSCICG_44670 [Pseudomonas cichorii]|nr:hypothetical protein PSCICG_44670 [Pseudomonas cichorii]